MDCFFARVRGLLAALALKRCSNASALAAARSEGFSPLAVRSLGAAGEDFEHFHPDERAWPNSHL